MAQHTEEFSIKRKTQPTNLESHTVDMNLAGDVLYHHGPILCLDISDSVSDESRWELCHRDSMQTTRPSFKSEQSIAVRFMRKHKNMQATLQAHFSQGIA